MEEERVQADAAFENYQKQWGAARCAKEAGQESAPSVDIGPCSGLLAIFKPPASWLEQTMRSVVQRLHSAQM